MAIRVFLILLLGMFGGIGCGSEPGETASPPAVEAAPGETSVAGLYQVRGLTTENESGDQREIAGTIILTQQGGEYTSTFSLRTMFPTGSGPLPAEVIGKGEGAVNGNVLTGTAQTQIVMSTVAGVDSSFAFVPRRVSESIVSATVTELTADGQVKVEIRSEPSEGSNYASTTTRLEGELVSKPGSAVPLR